MTLSHVAHPKENNATRQLSHILSHDVARDKQCDKRPGFLMRSQSYDSASGIGLPSSSDGC